MSYYKHRLFHRQFQHRDLKRYQRLKNTKDLSLFLYFFSLFQKNLDPDKDPEKTTELEEETPDYFSRIRCPACFWRPRESDRWFCGSCGHPEYYFHGCGTAWNTFITRGRCPGCNHQWRWTACLACHQWSVHEEWYISEKSS